MKFGKSWDEVQAEPATSGGYMKYFKDGDTTFRILQEPQEWIGYWEHFNPGGFGFPCTGDRKACPGCTSSNEKMKKAGRKIAIQVLEGEYVNVYKFPKTLADKISNRANRIGTITDRDYTISRFKSGDKVEYDVEGGDKVPVDIKALREQFKDVEAMLQESYDEAWGDSDKALQSRAAAEDASHTTDLKSKLAAAAERQFQAGNESDRPPSEPEAKQDAEAEGAGNVYTEEDLRSMDKSGILAVCDKEGLTVPAEVQQREVNDIVDWLLEQ